MWISTVVLFNSIYLSFVLSAPDDLGEVVFVTFLFRHGDRTPIDPYPHDPYKNNSLWPVGWGELTDVGKRGHYNLGKWLRNRYDNLLPKKYRREDIFIQSTDVDRTLMSAYSNLAGLYEPNLNSNWNPDIKWDPIPVHTIPEKLDKVLAARAPCPKYSVELNKLEQSREFQKINEKYRKLYQYLSQNTGMNVTNIFDVSKIHDTLFIENLYNFTLPNWTKIVYPQPMKDISAFAFSVRCYTRTLSRLQVGPLLGEILGHMKHKIKGKMKPDRKAWMYSAHDITVANVLKALDLFQPHNPPYLSLILFELRKKGKDYFVTIEYRNSSEVPPQLMQLKSCDTLCPFDDFQKIISPLIPNNWEEECHAIHFATNIYDTTAYISFVTIIFLALIFFLSSTLVIKFYKNQRWNQADFAYKSLKIELT